MTRSPRSQVFPPWSHQRCLQQWQKSILDLLEKTRGYAFRCLGCNISSKLGKVALCCARQPDDLRTANSLLPRSMIWSALNSVNLPAATSASPLSISALSAAISSF